MFEFVSLENPSAYPTDYTGSTFFPGFTYSPQKHMHVGLQQDPPDLIETAKVEIVQAKVVFSLLTVISGLLISTYV